MIFPAPPARLDAREVKARADLAAIAGKFTRLRRRGRQFVGLCPLHRERHPSFYVEPERGVWFCFGCQRGGDVFAFVMQATGCDFRRSLEIVAQASGVASESEPRSGERFRASVGDGVPSAREAGAPNSQSKPTRDNLSALRESRARILAALDDTNRLLEGIAATNAAYSASLWTACEPERGKPLLLEETG